MKTTPRTKLRSPAADEMKSEYRFDYSKARVNRFASRATAGSVAVVLDPDVAGVFSDAASVNAVLRALVATMPTGRAATRVRRQA